MKYNRVLTIAGSDSGGGAGIQADIKTISACGSYAASAITAITVQNTIGVSAVHPLPIDIIEGQIDAVLSDIGADAVKIGMLHSSEVMISVKKLLQQHAVKNIVLDPVMVSTSGHKLMKDEAIETLMHELLHEARVITPNIPEAQILLEKTLTDHLILDFDIAPHTRYGITLPSQHSFKLKAQRYPGVKQQRLKLADNLMLNEIDAIKIEQQPPQGFASFEAALAKHAEKLNQNPMHLTSFWWMNPVRLSQKDECYFLIDATNHMMPIELNTEQFTRLWMMVSNQPFYAGLEWNGLDLKLISLWQGAHYQCL